MSNLKFPYEIFLTLEQGNLNKLKKYINECNDINEPIIDGFNLLHFSTAFNHSHIVAYLLKNGADIEYRTKIMNETALYMACQNNYLDTIKVIISYNANIENQR